MDMNTEIGILLTYSFVIFAIYFFGYIFLIPMKLVLKLVLNSFFGGLFLIILNLVGEYFSFHIPLNIVSAVVVGILGVPGSIVLLVLQTI